MTAAILEAAKRSIPRGCRKDYKPYWSKTLATLHQELSEAREGMEQNPCAQTKARHNELKEEFNSTKTKEIQQCWHETTSALSLENSTGKLWKLTKALNDDVTTTYRATVLEDDDEFHTGKRAANLLASVFEEESKIKVPTQRKREVGHELREKTRQQANPTPPMTSDFTMADLSDAIKRLKNKKSPGKDGVCNEMIKHLGLSARNKLLELFNLSWKSGIFPSAWKEAVIIPVLKKGKDPKKKTSYRPISLLSCLGKTLERMVNKQLMWHLETNNLITKEQTAFRKNRNTEDQVIHLAQSIENAFQEKKKVIATFLDLSKAFDKVWKEGLLLKLLKSGINGCMFNWIKSFLCHRSARVKLNNSLSSKVKIRQGVPQGGVISPTLFLVFINDITEGLSRHISRALHADDFAIWNASESIATAQVRMQDALNNTSKWAKDWCVTINSLKTVATCFSLSNIREKFNLTINNQQIPQDDTPTYLGIKLDKRITWNPHIKEMEKRATKRLSIMKKLAGTKWGANSRILRQVYTGNVRPVMEYGSAAWATAAKTNTTRLAKVQNAGLRLITGGLKTTPINALESTTGLPSLDTRREERVLTQHEKLQRLPSHPAHQLMQEHTKNRLKRSSFNHQAKKLMRTHSDILPSTPEEREMLYDAEEWSTADHVSLVTEVPGVTRKGDQPDCLLKSLTLEMLLAEYNASVWTRIYTDGSADGAVKNGGSGIHICHPNGQTQSKSLPAGQKSTNYRAELTALREAAKLISAEEHLPSHIVFLTDCKSAIQNLQSPSEKLERDTLQQLKDLSQNAQVTVQWIPAHCGLSGNETADKLAKSGSRLEQTNPPISYREAKTAIKSQYKKLWDEEHNHPSDDQLPQLERHEQTTIFRLRTGHCRLRAHLHRIGLSHTPDCPCETGSQTPEHILQSCPLHQDARIQSWPIGATLTAKLWGTLEDLQTTAAFIHHIGLEI